MSVMKRHVKLMLMAVLTALLLSQCTKQEPKEKIKLDSAAIRQTKDSSGLATTLQVPPEDRRSIVIFHFENIAGNKELNWMQRGLAQMLVTDLSQSRYVDVVSEQDLGDTMERMGIKEGHPLDASLAVAVAKEARMETALVGSFIKIGETIRIDCHLYDARTGKLLKADRVEGKALEEVFTLVDELTREVRDGLKLTLKGVVEFDKGLAEVTTNSIEAYRYFAEGLERHEKLFYQEAADNFERAVAIDTTFATAYLHLTRAYINLARSNDARRIIAKAVAFSDHITERERLNIMALDASLKGDYLVHLEILERMVQFFPNDKETHYQLARMYERLRRFDEAIAQYEAALGIDPAYKLVYNQLGYTYSNRGMHEEAVKSLKRYIELVPDEPNPHDSMGEIYKFAGLMDEAVDEFKEAIRLGPDLHFPWAHLGLTYQDKGEFDEALRCFQRYIDLAPSEAIKAGGFQLVGETYWAQGELRKALEAYKEALKVYPNDFGNIINISELYMDQGDLTGAKAYQDEWFRRQGESVLEEGVFKDILSFVIICYYLDIHTDDLEPFVDQAYTVAENDRNRSSCIGLRALLALKRGDIDSTLALWKETLAFPSIENKIGLGYYDARIVSEALKKSTDKPEEVQALYEKIVEKARELDNPSFESATEYFLFEFYKKLGNEGGIDRGLKITGTPRESDWWIIGPFENKGGFHHRFGPEKEIRLTDSYNGKGGRVHWSQTQDSLFNGYIDLKEIFEPDIWTVAYGLLSFDCPTDRQAQFLVGTDDGIRIWLNGEEVWTRNVRRGAVSDNDIVSVELKEGTNTVLIKVCQTISEWGFFFRVTDPKGKAFDDMTFSPHIAS